jgi:predicted NBD/HSP70 family sugar kinase
MALIGGIDLGGSKIEAALFDEHLDRLTVRRIATPREDYEQLLEALAEQIDWLRHEADAEPKIGIGCPGFFDPETGLAYTANLPARGKPFQADLRDRTGAALVMGQDLKCFALSEANGGAGAGAAHVFGLILGTGLGGALCHRGTLITGQNGLLGEIGHVPLSLRSAERHSLPVWPCGCGLAGCYESYVSGPGITALARHTLGHTISPPDIAAGAAAGDPDLARIMKIWLELAAEVLQIIQVALDPDCVVLGGGLSKFPNLVPQLAAELERIKLPGSRAPRLALAKFGDSSGTRGAAIIAASGG